TVLTCDGNAAGEGLVYIFMGGPSGIASTPSFILRGTDAAGAEFFGWSMTTVDWNEDGVDDVAIGAPFAAAGEGAVFIFLGQSGTGSKWTPGASATVLSDTQADVIVRPDQSDPFLSGFSSLGFQVDSLDFDGDGNVDLAIAAASAGADGSGAAIILF